MFKEYRVDDQTESDNWRIISIPERKLPRMFLVSRNYTLRGLTSNQTYLVKVAAVNTYGQGEYSTVTSLLVYRTSSTTYSIHTSSPVPLQYQIYYTGHAVQTLHCTILTILGVLATTILLY